MPILSGSIATNSFVDGLISLLELEQFLVVVCIEQGLDMSSGRFSWVAAFRLPLKMNCANIFRSKRLVKSKILIGYPTYSRIGFST